MSSPCPLKGTVSQEFFNEFWFKKLNQYIFNRCGCLKHLFLPSLFIFNLKSFILFLEKCFRIFTDFPKYPCCRANSCSKAAWELQISIIKPPRNLCTLLRRLWKVVCSSNVASENLFVAPFSFRKAIKHYCKMV